MGILFASERCATILSKHVRYQCGLARGQPARVQEEKQFGLRDIKTYRQFAEAVFAVKEKAWNFVDQSKESGKKIIGYGAPAKATTFLNFCQLTNKEIAYVIDDNPLKQGKFIPGTSIEIKEKGSLEKEQDFNILILAWNFANEIFEKNKDLCEKGVRFFTTLPEPREIK